VTASTGGVFAGILLALHNLIMAVGYFTGARGAVQEASIGTIWIAGNVLWGVCVLVGRKRIYVVTREEQPPA
jgi:hypothetical protein